MAVRARRDSSLDITLAPATALPNCVPPAASLSAGQYVPPADLPVIDLLSDGPLPALSDPPEARGLPASPPQRRQKTHSVCPEPQHSSSGRFWLEGDALFCGCPDCSAPMTVRIWLMLADCWRCGASIELTEQEEREVQQLLERRRHEVAGAAAARPKREGEAAKAGGKGAPAEANKRPAAEPASPQRSPRPVPAGRKGVQRRVEQIATAKTATAWLRDLLGMLPAWLVSLVFHFLLLTLLALLTLKPEQAEPTITLSTAVSKDVRPGGEVEVADPRDEVQFDLPLPSNIDLEDEKLREAVVRADQDARQLRIDPDEPPDVVRPDLALVKEQIRSVTAPRRAFAARDPRLRVEIVKREGGTTLTEAAVARGLRWLAHHQRADGSWSLHSFRDIAGCSCRDAGKKKNDAAATSLALLPFLGAGQTHLAGRYRDTVARGLRWMITHQRRDGYLTARFDDDPQMYAHGQGTIVLCEAYAMEGDENLREAAQKAVDFIVQSQYTDGGWRYSPRQARSGMNSQGDTSVFGWQLMALQSARAAGLVVPEETLVLASHYLDAVEYRPRRSVSLEFAGRYGYLRGKEYSPVMTAEALLCRIYLGWTKDNRRLAAGIRWLSEEQLPTRREPNMYYWYYATQLMHHWGGVEWERWNRIMREILVHTQETRGHQAGSWSPYDRKTGRQFAWGSAGGRLYLTALATCTLEVYYRHLPLFKQIDIQ